MRSILLVFLFLGFDVFAAEAKISDFTLGAEFRFRDVFEQNPTLQGNANTPQNSAKSRVKLNVGFRATEKFTATLTLLHAARWGAKDPSLVGDSSTGNSDRATADGVGNSDNTVLVQQAFGAWLIADSFLLKFGRSSFGIGDGTVIAENDYEDVPLSFEGLWGIYEWDFMRLTAFVLKLANFSSSFNKLQAGALGTQPVLSGSTAANPDANAYGLSLDFKLLPSWLKSSNFYVLKNQKDTSPGTGSTLATTNLTDLMAGLGEDTLRFGASIEGEVAHFDYHLSYNGISGNYRGVDLSVSPAGQMCSQSSCKADSFMVQATVGFTVPKWLHSRFFATYHMDSGQKSGEQNLSLYDGYFYEQHEITNGGLMGLLRWGNLTYSTLGYSNEPFEQLEAGILLTNFSRTETGSQLRPGVYGRGIFDLYTSASSASADVGREIDIYAIRKYDNGFELEARFGVFMPGAYSKDINSGHADNDQQIFLQGKMVF